MIQRTLAVALLSVALAAPAISQGYADPLRRALPSAEYARRAAANDLYQRQAAQLILRGSRNPAIRKLAQSLLAEHGRTAADLRGAAAKAKIPIEAERSTTEFMQMIDKLTIATGEMRDALYLAQQRAVHQRAAAMHEDYAKGGDDPGLKETAARIAAIEQSHLDMIAVAAMPPQPLPVSTSPTPRP